MTRQPHDDLAKNYLCSQGERFGGQAQSDRRVTSEVRQIDVFFEPEPSALRNVARFGLLGGIFARTCAIEIFRNAPKPLEVRLCQLKLAAIQGERSRASRREDLTLDESQLPMLWILAPTASRRFLRQFGAVSETDWPQGVYFFPSGQQVGLIAIHQLPKTRDTLWLRILGRGRVQQQAIAELTSLCADDPMVRDTLEILANWRANLEARASELDTEAREAIVQLSPAYLRWREEAIREGIEIGERRGEQRGERRGEQRGERRGEQRGIALGQEQSQRAIALNFLSMGLAIEQVARGTGLSVEQIRKLQSQASSES